MALTAHADVTLNIQSLTRACDGMSRSRTGETIGWCLGHVRLSLSGFAHGHKVDQSRWAVSSFLAPITKCW